MSTSDDQFVFSNRHIVKSIFDNNRHIVKSIFDADNEEPMEAPDNFINEYKSPEQQNTASCESESTSSETNKSEDVNMENTAEQQYEVIEDESTNGTSNISNTSNVSNTSNTANTSNSNNDVLDNNNEQLYEPVSSEEHQEEETNDNHQQQFTTVHSAVNLSSPHRTYTPDIRRPNFNMNDSTIRYEESYEVRSRMSYNAAISNIHSRYWTSGKSPIEHPIVTTQSKIKKNGTRVTFIWDEGGMYNGRGFATTATDGNNKCLEPLLVINPLSDIERNGNILILNWRHAKLPVNKGYHIVTASSRTTIENDNKIVKKMVTVYQIADISVENDYIPGKRSYKDSLAVNLLFWMTIDENSNEERHDCIENNISSDDEAIKAVLKQCTTEEVMQPAFCKKFVTLFNRDYKLYLTDSGFETISRIWTDNTELNDVLEQQTSEYLKNIQPMNQLRVYRICKYFPMTTDITVFYFVVYYDPINRSYYDNRLMSEQITFKQDATGIHLFGDANGVMYTFDELLQMIQSANHGGQIINEFRRVAQ